MSWFLIFILIISFLFNNLSQAKHEKKLPSAVVVGTVYCDTCFQQEFSKSSYFISDASVAVECGDGSSKPSFSKEVKTNKRGEFRVNLPFTVSKHVKRIKECSVKLVSSSEPFCSVASRAASASLHLKSRKQGVHIFSAGFFTFKPLREPDLCNHKPSLESSKELIPKKSFLPNSGIPTFPPVIEDPIIPNVPSFTPTSPYLSPLPILPRLPPFPSLPTLPPLPPLSGLSNLPPLSNANMLSKKTVSMQQNVNYPTIFFPPPLLPPLFPAPPPLIPNPFQPPPLLPPLPFQPPPPPVFNFPPIPGLSPPPSPPPFFNFPPVPGLSPPPSPPPIFSFPPVPGLSPPPSPPSPSPFFNFPPIPGLSPPPSPPPPPPPRLPFPFPPFLFPPPGGFPGIPPTPPPLKEISP